MSVTETHIVDFIGIENETGKVSLVISTHLEWGQHHLSVLQDKINTYIAFVESGEILDAYPDAIRPPADH